MTKFPKINSINDVKQIELKPLDDYLSESVSYQIIERAAQLFPDNIAVYDMPDGYCTRRSELKSYSYLELLNQVNSYANYFSDLDILETDVISTMLPNLFETHALFWAIQSQAIINPINPMFDDCLIIELLKKAKTTYLVILDNLDEDFFIKIENIKKALPELKILYLSELSNANKDNLNFSLNLNKDRVCAYFHTSGTTGKPKLVKLNQQNIVYMAWAAKCVFYYKDTDVFLMGLPLFHSAASCVGQLAMAYAGGALALLSPWGWANPQVIENIWHTVQSIKATIIAALPNIYHQIYQVSSDEKNLSSLRLLISGMPLTDSFQEKIKYKIDNDLSIYNIYGLTEATSLIANGYVLPFQKCSLKSINAGFFPNNFDCVGELLVEGPNISPGYINKQSKKILETRDLATIVDKQLIILDRMDNLIHYQPGRYLIPLIIEQQLLNHPDINNVAIVGIEDDSGYQKIHCFIESHNSNLATNDIAIYLSNFYKEELVPFEQIHFDIKIPKNAMAKCDKVALKTIGRKIINDGYYDGS